MPGPGRPRPRHCSISGPTNYSTASRNFLPVRQSPGTRARHPEQRRTDGVGRGKSSSWRLGGRGFSRTGRRKDSCMGRTGRENRLRCQGQPGWEKSGLHCHLAQTSLKPSCSGCCCEAGCLHAHAFGGGCGGLHRSDPETQRRNSRYGRQDGENSRLRSGHARCVWRDHCCLFQGSVRTSAGPRHQAGIECGLCRICCKQTPAANCDLLHGNPTKVVFG